MLLVKMAEILETRAKSWWDRRKSGSFQRIQTSPTSSTPQCRNHKWNLAHKSCATTVSLALIFGLGGIGLHMAALPSFAASLPAPSFTKSYDANQPLNLDKGHVDLFCLHPVVQDKTMYLSLSLCEDATDFTTTEREPNTVILQVPSRAWQTETKKLPGLGQSLYALPETQDPALLWPGWSSLELPPDFHDVTYSIESVTHFDTDGNAGTGQIYLWQSQGLGNPVGSVLKNGSLTVTDGSEIIDPKPAHRHVNWGFTEAGYYQMRVSASAQDAKGQTFYSNPATYTWMVDTEALTEDETEVADELTPGKPPAGAGNKPGLPQRKTGPKKQSNPKQLHAKPGERQGNGETAGGAGVKRLQEALNRAFAAAESDTNVAAPTQSGSLSAHAAGGNTRLTTKVGGAKTLELGTHVHPNWVFTTPGTYEVDLDISTVLSGAKISKLATLRFNVGGAGNADSGHFDLGPAITDGELYALVKNDNTSPASWVDPASLTFGLGPASRATAPAGIEFIAKEGQQVWMVGSTQVNGVPWLGVNTQHPSLHEAGAGKVTYTLRAVRGPGALAVFTSGNFGKPLGELWFGGAVAAADGSNIGRESLARTGVDSFTAALAFLAVSLILGGVGAITLGRSYRKTA